MERVKKMTQKQKLWASQHDWFISETPQGVLVYDSEIDKAITIENFKALRDWAGY